MSNDAAQFEASLALSAPPPGYSTPLQALWRAAKGEWEVAHELAQSDDSADAAWVHAHLHRIEGDLRNAGYWYRRAGKPEHTGDLATERRELAAALR